jgi:uncharacterized protein with ParB-like and HNH nuclease domain
VPYCGQSAVNNTFYILPIFRKHASATLDAEIQRSGATKIQGQGCQLKAVTSRSGLLRAFSPLSPLGCALLARLGWTEKECRQLWEDILRAGGNDAVSAHFIGSIIYIEAGLSTITSQSPLLVIDGQQRLTTLSILIAALTKALGEPEPLDGFSAHKLRHYYLLNPEETGQQRYKLLLTQTDTDSLKAIVDHRQFPTDHSLRVMQNYGLFSSWIAACQTDLVPICKGLAKLIVVDISLNRDQDNPQLIFESMNSTGRELSQADLIRNFILMGLEPNPQTRLYEQ